MKEFLREVGKALLLAFATALGTALGNEVHERYVKRSPPKKEEKRHRRKRPS